MAKYGKIIGQVLQLLAGGFMLGYIRDKRMRRQIYQECDRVWYSIDKRQLFQLLDYLKLNGVIKIIKDNNGIEKVNLTNRGQARLLKYNYHNLVIKRAKRWDKKWRIVIFDIPETKRKVRDALRSKLKKFGFLELQKSIFIYPFSCRDEINFVINFWGISDNVYYLESTISGDNKLRRYFRV